MAGYWVVRTITAGKVGEKTKYWVPGAKPDRRSKRKEKLAEKKQKENEYSAVKCLARELNANFGKGDDLIGLDYSPEGLARLEKYRAEHPDIVEPSGDEKQDHAEALRIAARRELVNFIRRVRRECQKLGIDVKITGAIVSDMDGDSGEHVRVHHHFVCSGGVREILVRKWKELGGVDWSELREQDDYTAVAEYLLRQVRPQKNEKKWTSTRNLTEPVVKDRIALSDSDLRVPKGGELIFRAGYKKGGSQYIRYTLPKTERRRE